MRAASGSARRPPSIAGSISSLSGAVGRCRRADLRDVAVCYHSSISGKQLKRENFRELVKIIVAICLPPLAVFLQVGIGKHFWINLLLTLLGYIPGIVHAVWVIAKNK